MSDPFRDEESGALARVDQLEQDKEDLAHEVEDLKAKIGKLKTERPEVSIEKKQERNVAILALMVPVFFLVLVFLMIYLKSHDVMVPRQRPQNASSSIGPRSSPDKTKNASP